jgi:hypothetical protein
VFCSAERLSGLRLACAALLAAVVGGCAQQPPRQPARPPLVVDGAMQRREWDRSVAPYPNGDTVSGHNRFPFRTDSDRSQNEYPLAAYDIAASLGQTVALPFTYLFIPPFARAVYHGDDIGPTYTAMPAMRPPATTVNVDGLVVDRDTLEVKGRPGKEQDERYRRHGPMGPGDSEFDTTAPAPAAEEFD